MQGMPKGIMYTSSPRLLMIFRGYIVQYLWTIEHISKMLNQLKLVIY